jgi:hypothetical protein
MKAVNEPFVLDRARRILEVAERLRGLQDFLHPGTESPTHTIAEHAERVRQLQMGLGDFRSLCRETLLLTSHLRASGLEAELLRRQAFALRKAGPLRLLHVWQDAASAGLPEFLEQRGISSRSQAHMDRTLETADLVVEATTRGFALSSANPDLSSKTGPRTLHIRNDGGPQPPLVGDPLGDVFEQTLQAVVGDRWDRLWVSEADETSEERTMTLPEGFATSVIQAERALTGMLRYRQDIGWRFEEGADLASLGLALVVIAGVLIATGAVLGLTCWISGQPFACTWWDKIFWLGFELFFAGAFLPASWLVGVYLLADGIGNFTGWYNVRVERALPG